MLILRSRSPRRREVFDALGLLYSVDAYDIDESSFEREDSLEYLKRITIAKLGPGLRNTLDVQVSADTIVVRDGAILQKPSDEADAISMLSSLVDRKHQVFSGMAIRNRDREIFDYDVSEVFFLPWNQDEILDYVRRNKPYDKAGAYGIQDPGSPVRSFTGSYTNILGFPIRKFFQYHSIWADFLGKKG
ncbi:maf-like protein [Leptospira fainei serovar Hurstbridge str. BUT 6]|uniref:dTTP/UTP pyrophosphatase n=1 Tax=Leptospira fainei serovar Hurstbridge str. BUT 6 TaxID=1193011 RepID=S3V1R8_9LEPT|nr:nucleoside triphosphate pyrophosphatase [Leptospira fainei]EPG74534.1 maf-like protein [Leptospira fainei serovar Hurstbridge str. BUT 6]